MAEMTQAEQELYEAAKAAREHAIAPFTHCRNGAALQAASNKIYTGCNIESPSYILNICCERQAICNALSAGERQFKKIAVVHNNAEPTTPCGACRQALWEFAGNIEVLMFNLAGEMRRFQLAELLPESYELKV